MPFGSRFRATGRKPRVGEITTNEKEALERVSSNGLDIRYVSPEARRSKDVILAAVRKTVHALKFVDDDIMSDLDMAKAILKVNGMALQYLSASLRKNTEVVSLAIKHAPKSFKHAGDELRRDPHFVLKHVESTPTVLTYASEQLQCDRDFVAECVGKNVRSFRYASLELRNDAAIVLEFIGTFGAECMHGASANLKSDEGFVAKCLEEKWETLKHVDAAFKMLKDVVRVAVNIDGRSLLLASPEIRKDPELLAIALSKTESAPAILPKVLAHVTKDVWLEAIRRDVDVLDLIPENHMRKFWSSDQSQLILDAISVNAGAAARLTATDVATTRLALVRQPEALEHIDDIDEELVLDAIADNHVVFRHGSLRDQLFVRKAIQRNGLVLEFLDEDGRSDKTIVMNAVRQNGQALRFAARALRGDKDFVLKVVAIHGDALEHVDGELKEDRAVVLTAAKQDGLAIRFAGRRFLKLNPDIAQAAVEQNARALEFVGNTNADSKDLVSLAVSRDGTTLKYASYDQKNSRAIVGLAVRQNGLALEHAGEKLRDDTETVLSAVAQNGLALEHASERLRRDENVVLTAAGNTLDALQHTELMFSDAKFMAEVVEQNIAALKYVKIDKRDEENGSVGRDFLREILSNDGRLLKLVSDEAKANQLVVLAAVKQDGMALQFASLKLREWKPIVRVAVRQNGMALRFAGEALRRDTEIVMDAVSNSGLALEFAMGECYDDDRIVAAALRNDPAAIEFASDRFDPVVASTTPPS